ncbi:MAG: acetolactate synthase large subunit [Actinomycetota bacterium]|nr:acetolactate synthase large subunit [Actinomycetota bacterium]
MLRDVPTGHTGPTPPGAASGPARPDDVPADRWGSDAIAESLRLLDLRYVALTPGSSFRGLHDSLVNHLGNHDPQLLVCLHEEHAVAIAHGYAKVTERPMAVAVHSNVGLMHATMAIFNAWCDRAPMVIIGATGPLDAADRRPWIDWIHTSADQGALVRPYVKWDDQPGSAQAAVDSLVRAAALAASYPTAPVYVCLDAGVQEARLDQPVRFPDVTRFAAVPTLPPSQELAAQVAQLLADAERPVILAGRVGRSGLAWQQRVELAERVGAIVLTDLKVAAAFPTDHPLHPVPPSIFLNDAAKQLLASADIVLSLDWLDLGGTLRQAFGSDVSATVISCSGDHALHNGWSKDHFEQPPVDLAVDTHPDLLVAAMLDQLAAPSTAEPRPRISQVSQNTAAPSMSVAGTLTMTSLADALQVALAGQAVCLARVPLGWRAEAWPFGHPLDYTGLEGGAGVGAGPGIAVGVALGLEGSGRLAVAIMGDGDFLMGASALWTAGHHGLPLLVVVANNQSFFNDEVHQQRVALQRARPVENRWIGQRIANPTPDVAALARSFGLAGYGPVTESTELAGVLRRAVDDALAGKAVVVDVMVDTADYPGLAASQVSAGASR